MKKSRYVEDLAQDINTINRNKKKVRKVLIEPPVSAIEYEDDELDDDTVLLSDEEDLNEQEDFSAGDGEETLGYADQTYGNQNAAGAVAGYEDPYAASGMMAMGMGGGYGTSVNKPGTADELGRFYELKKIHERLTSIEAYLSDENNSKLLKVRKYVSDALELFDLVMSNFMKFQDSIDDIIIKFYRFISNVYKIIYDHYKEQSDDTKNK